MIRSSNMGKILVVEDDAAIAAGIVRGVKAAGFEVELATTGPLGLHAALHGKPDLIVLDLMLPEMRGDELLRQLRASSTVPVIVLTASGTLDDRLKAFGLGADDFLAKPFWFEELLARIRTRLRIQVETPHRIIAWSNAEIDLDARVARVNGKDVELTPSEFLLVAFLAERRNRAVSRMHLVEALGAGVSDRTVDSHLARARKKLGEAGSAIATVWGIGYRINIDETPRKERGEDPIG